MGRSSRGSSRASRPSTASSTGYRPRPTATSTGSSNQSRQGQQQQQQHQQPHHTTTIVQPVGGGGLMGGSMMGNMAGAMVGSVVGHSLANRWFGHREEQPQEAPAPEQVQAQVPPSSYQNMMSSSNGYDANSQMAQQQDPCAQPWMTFNRCVEANNGNSTDCQWAWEMVNKCKADPAKFQQQQFGNGGGSF